MPTYTTPGVYFERVDQAPQVSALRTDVAAFVGLAACGPLHTPVRLTSWEQFSSAFGGLVGTAFLGYAVKAFFENGGVLCYAVRVAADDAAPAFVDVLDGAGTPLLRVEASSPGTWADGLEVRIVQSAEAATTTVGPPPAPNASRVSSIAGFAPDAWVRLVQPGSPSTMRVVAGVDAAQGVLTWDAAIEGEFDPGHPISLETVQVAVRAFERGRLVEDHPDVPVVPLDGGRRPVLADGSTVRVLRHPLSPTDLSAFHDPAAAALGFGAGRESAPLGGGRDGLSALTRVDFTGEPGGEERRGLQTLELVDEVSLVAIPDILVRPLPPVETLPLPQPEPDLCLPCAAPAVVAPTPAAPAEQPPLFSASDVAAVQAALVQHCEQQRDRVALLDPPFAADLGAVQSWRARFDSKFAALYYPWVLVYDPLSKSLVRAIPPSGHVAGVCARVDLSAGVHEAPANQELAWAVGVALELDAELHGVLNPLGINCIRPIPGRGIRILGARTVSSDADWRFLNVRRLMNMIEEAVEESVQWATFESNDLATRDLLALSIRSFLERLWQRGALVGERPDDAFFIKCDDETNPPAEVGAGRMLAEVGVAPVRPAEFVVFRIGRTQDELEVIE
jgi:phage tail sheath protein FI